MPEKLYPEDAARDPKFAHQEFEPGYTPRALDSLAAAKARMLAHMETTTVEKPYVVAVGLNGSDEVPAVEALYDELIAERKRLLALDRTAPDYAAKVEATAVNLNATKWLAARPAVAKAL